MFKPILRKNAMTPFKSFFDEMEKFFDDDSMQEFGNINLDIVENDDSYEIEADLPGVDKKDINVSAENGLLTIEAKIEKEDKKEEKNYIRRERSERCFKRSLRFGNDVDAENVDAVLENGVLKIKLGKKEEAAPKKIEVK